MYICIGSNKKTVNSYIFWKDNFTSSFVKKLVIDEYREKCDLQKRRLFSIFVRFKVNAVA